MSARVSRRGSEVAEGERGRCRRQEVAQNARLREGGEASNPCHRSPSRPAVIEAFYLAKRSARAKQSMVRINAVPVLWAAFAVMSAAGHAARSSARRLRMSEQFAGGGLT